MKKLFKIVFMFVLFMIPYFVSAATGLSASTQNPVVGESFFVQLNINYGEDALISEVHYVITYDETAMEFEKVNWTQSPGEYRYEPGKIYIDKYSNTRSWAYGGQVQMRFKTLRSDSIQVRVQENGRAKYENGAYISQYFSGVTVNSINPSNVSTLNSLYVENYEILPTFSRETKNYTLHVPANETQVNVVAKQGEAHQRITGLGERILNYGANRVDVGVYAQDGSYSEYRLMIYREDDRTGDVSLNRILVNSRNLMNGEEDLEKDTFTTVVGRSTDSIMLTAKTTDPKATLIGTGSKALNIGENVFKLKVLTTNDKEKEYTVIVRRSEEEIKPDVVSSKLSRLAINNMALDLSNDKKVFLYGVSSNVEQLDLSTVTESPTANVEINGNSRFQAGANVVNIKVTETTGEVSEYKIIVHKDISGLYEIKNFSNIPNNGNGLLFVRSENDNSIISKEDISNLKDNSEILYYNVVNMNNGLLYQLKFNKYDYNDAIDTKITKDENNTYITNIPAGVEVKFYMGDTFADNTILKIYTYNEDGNYNALTDGVTVNYGYVTFKTNGDSKYVFTTQTLVKEESTIERLFNQYKIYILGAGVVVLLLILFSSAKKKKNKNNVNNKKKELSY